MFRKRMIAIIIAIGMSGLVACAPTATSTQQESTTPQETTTVNNNESTSAEEGTSTEYDNTSDVYGRVDVEDICKHIMINGKQVDFPWTLNALGEEYEFQYASDTISPEGVSAAVLAYKGRRGASVIIYEQDKIDRESVIYDIRVSVYNDGIQLYNFNSSTITKDIEVKLGIPDEVYVSSPDIYYFYQRDDLDLSFGFDEEEKTLHYIKISLKEAIDKNGAE